LENALAYYNVGVVVVNLEVVGLVPVIKCVGAEQLKRTTCDACTGQQIIGAVYKMQLCRKLENKFLF
jgi:hypothetical protein